MEKVELMEQIANLQDKMEQAKKEVSYYEDRLKELTKNMVKCDDCGLYFPEEAAAVGHYTQTETEVTFSDCGYGDDDLIAEVTRLYTSTRCPKCGHEITRSSIVLKTVNERKRK